MDLEAAGGSELLGIARFKFHAGKVEEFKRLAHQCMDIMKTKDTGTLQYDIYVNNDQSQAIVSSGTATRTHSSSTSPTSAPTSWQPSQPPETCTARRSASRATSCERRWPLGRSSCSRPTWRCRCTPSTTHHTSAPS